MPVTVKKIGNKYRIVEAEHGTISMTNHNHATDGGGHETKEEAERQARAINMSISKRS